MPVLTDQRRASRVQAMECVLASGRMEGLEPSAGAMAIFHRYIGGELTLEQMGAAIDEYADIEYGPVRLRGHERT